MEVSAIRALSDRPVVGDGPRAGGGNPLILPAGQLIEALGGPNTQSAPRRFLLDTLLKDGSLSARLLAQNTAGEALLDANGTRFLVRLPEQRRIGETLVLTLRGGVPTRVESAPGGGPGAQRSGGAANSSNLASTLASSLASNLASSLPADLAGTATGATLASGTAAGAARIAAATPPTQAAGAAYAAAQDGVDGFSSLAQLLTRLAALAGGAAGMDSTGSATTTDPAAAEPAGLAADKAALRARVIDAPVSRPEAFAAALDHSIGTSGVFYEAHLARWARGDYPLSRLSQEPQFEAQLGGTRDLGPTGRAGEGPPVIAERLAPLVAQQLAAVENQTITWSGQIWPGQQARLEIQPDPPHSRRGSGEGDDATGADGQPLVWITRLTLDLPQLGHVEALVALRGQHVALSLTADSPRGAARLSAFQPGFENALQARGLQSCGFFVSHIKDGA